MIDLAIHLALVALAVICILVATFGFWLTFFCIAFVVGGVTAIAILALMYAQQLAMKITRPNGLVRHKHGMFR